MTYLTERILQEPILHSQFLRLALISLALIALQATPASAQWTNGNNTVYTTNNVGIGTPLPAAPLHISSINNPNVLVDAYLTGSNLRFRRANGTASSPSAVLSGDVLGNFNFTGYGTSGFATTGRVIWQAYAAENWTDNAQGAYIVISNTPTGSTLASERMRIDAAGNVGIGTGTGGPTTKLQVVGDGKFTGSLTVDGNIAAKYQDLAEWVPASEQIPDGTVVVLDSTKSNHVIPSTKGYDTRVAGVVSSQPGIALGERGDNKVLVATTGRVRIKVDATRSPIHVGDLLVTSDVPGSAMKSIPLKVSGRLMHMPGTLIGKALEPLEKGLGSILVLLSLQ